MLRWPAQLLRAWLFMPINFLCDRWIRRVHQYAQLVVVENSCAGSVALAKS
jgi:hypothetical protein